MTRHRGLTAGIGVLAILAGLLVGSAPPGRAATGKHDVTSGDCPDYSDGAIAAIGVPERLFPQFQALLARSRYGTVTVPLDYPGCPRPIRNESSAASR